LGLERSSYREWVSSAEKDERQDERTEDPAAGAALAARMNPGVVTAIRSVENPAGRYADSFPNPATANGYTRAANQETILAVSSVFDEPYVFADLTRPSLSARIDQDNSPSGQE
jgi:hypothetical protein